MEVPQSTDIVNTQCKKHPIDFDKFEAITSEPSFPLVQWCPFKGMDRSVNEDLQVHVDSECL